MVKTMTIQVKNFFLLNFKNSIEIQDFNGFQSNFDNRFREAIN